MKVHQDNIIVVILALLARQEPVLRNDDLLHSQLAKEELDDPLVQSACVVELRNAQAVSI